MPARYTEAAMRHAHYEQRPDGSYYGEIAGFPGDGVWALGRTPADCQEGLELALLTNVTVALRKGKGAQLPTFDGVRPDDGNT